jgi:20S proteasome alpha/beta subunit
MTVVLAVKNADGIVMGSDSQITDKAREMSYPGQKLHLMGDHAAWGGSGARSVLLDLEKIFDAQAASILEAPDIGRAIQERVLPVLQHHYDTFIEDVPGDEGGGTPSAYVLAAGYAGDEPFIIEITPNGMIGHYDQIGFHAVGSGAPMAQQAGTLLAHFNMAERSVDYGVVGVVRVLEALKVTAPSVGGDIMVTKITPEGAEPLSDTQIEKARKQVLRWEETEQENLDQLFT